jgi:phosphatidylserine/phosphatidylglycerophosphate/cardiolipin synthase-like enzyme
MDRGIDSRWKTLARAAIIGAGILANAVAFGAVALSVSAHGATNVALVQSIPAETPLAQPDLPHAQEAWIQLFRNARRTIDLGQFYLSNAPGSVLEPVIQELEKAGARGVKIRTIISANMLDNDPASVERFRKIPNAELRVLDLKNLTGGIIHAKYFVIDGSQVFIGSQNFDWKALSQIHETGVVLTDSTLARKLTQIFDVDWQICATGQAPTPATPLPTAPAAVELVASPPQFNPASVGAALPALQALLKGAKKSIHAQVMSYSTSGKDGVRWGAIDDELRAATARGVQVELMVADWNTGATEIAQLKDLQKAGVTIKIVTIPQLASGECISFSRVMHTKLLTVDGQVLWVGTSNWSRGYFEATRGVEMIFRMPELATQGERIFDTLWSSRYAALLNPEQTYTPPIKDCKPVTP